VVEESVDSANTVEMANAQDSIAELKRRGVVDKPLKEREIFNAVKEKELEKVILEEMDDVASGSVVMAKGIWHVIEARPTRLIHPGMQASTPALMMRRRKVCYTAVMRLGQMSCRQMMLRMNRGNSKGRSLLTSLISRPSV